MLSSALVERGVDLRVLRLAWASRIRADEVPARLAGRDGLARGAPVVLHFAMPHQVTTAVRPDARHANHTMFEAFPVPPDWVERAGRLPLTLVPTESGRRAWIESGAPEDRVRVSPLGVEPRDFRPGLEPLDLRDTAGRPVASYRHRLLTVAEAHPRKNLPTLYRAWLTAARGRDDAVWILKVSEGGPGQRERVAEACRAIAGEERSTAPVVILADAIPQALMPRLFASCTGYVSASRGEGWDLPMLEAAATDLTLIAPRHTAYADYLEDDVARLVAAEPSPVGDPAAGALFQKAFWHEPQFGPLVAALRDVLDGWRPQRSPRATVAEPRTWSAAADVLLGHLDALAA